MSWWQNGLIVCSNDGSILYIEFSPKEIWVPLSQKSFNSFHKKNFGKTSLAIDEDTLDDEEEDRGVIFQEDGNIVENLVMPSRVGGGWPRWLTDGSKKLRKNFFWTRRSRGRKKL